MQLKDIKAGEHTFSVVMPTTREGFRIQAKLMNIAALTYQGKLQGDEQYELLKSMLNGAEVDNQPLDFDKFFEARLTSLIPFSLPTLRRCTQVFWGRRPLCFNARWRRTPCRRKADLHA